MLKNDEVMNEILKKDLIDKKKLGDQMMVTMLFNNMVTKTVPLKSIHENMIRKS